MKFLGNLPVDDLVEAIETCALNAVLHPDLNANLRRIFRWYSETFSTPLVQVYNLPLDFVLQHYFEHTFTEAEDSQIEERIKWLLMTPEERKAQQIQEDTEKVGDEEFFRQAQEEATQGKIPNKIPPIPPLPAEKPEPSPKAPPDINVTYAEDNLWKEWESMDSMAPRSPDKSGKGR